jgi:hypothetical protein
MSDNNSDNNANNTSNNTSNTNSLDSSNHDTNSSTNTSTTNTPTNTSTTNTPTNTTPINTTANTVIDTSGDVIITKFTLNETIVDPNTVVTNQQGTTALNNQVTHTTLTTTNNELDTQLNQDLKEVISTYYDDINTSPNNALIQEIRSYAEQIQCSDFHGKGSIDDYSQLFMAASKIANETKQMNLDIDIAGFNEFGQAADDLSSLFTSFTLRLQNISIINDTNFLRSIIDALKKIVNLSNTFGKFKQTILATSSIQVPKSAHEAKVILESVTRELNCAMKYVTYFVDSSSVKPQDADLSAEEKSVISKAVDTIDHWNVLCEHGVTIALDNSPDVNYINQVNDDLKSKSNILKNATNSLRTKFAQYNISR